MPLEIAEKNLARHVDADGHPGQRDREQVRAIGDRILADGVADVDDLRVARDRQHDATADGGC